MDVPPEIIVQVDHEARLVSTTWRGSFDLAAIYESCRKRTRNGGHRYPQLVDAREADIARTLTDRSRLPGTVIDMAREVQKEGKVGPTAIIVREAVDFGTCRRIAAYFNEAGVIAPFYKEADALKWLETAT